MKFGDPVDVVMTKWRDRPHWSYRAHYLGRDGHGDWLGVAAGTRMTRPGAVFVAPVDQACLAPTLGDPLHSGWFATFYGWRLDGSGGGSLTKAPVDVYVDIATQPVWDGATIGSVDLDLDVIRGLTGRTWIDDEDEFADHRVSLDYPDDIIELALASCARVHEAVRDRVPPYDRSTSQRWLASVADLS